MLVCRVVKRVEWVDNKIDKINGHPFVRDGIVTDREGVRWVQCGKVDGVPCEKHKGLWFVDGVH